MTKGTVRRRGALWEESLAVARETGFDGAVTSSLANLGELAFEEGDAARGRSLLEEALAMHRATGSKYNIAYILKVLTTVAHHQGDLAAARAFLAESLPLLHETGHRTGIAQTLEAAAAVALTSGEAALAARLSGTAAAWRAEIAAHCRPMNGHGMRKPSPLRVPRWARSPSNRPLARAKRRPGRTPSTRC